MSQSNRLTQVSLFIVVSIFLLSTFAIVQNVRGASSTVAVTSQVTVGNSAPVVSNVVINGGSDIVLTPSSTTAVNVSFTVQDSNGCEDVFVNGNVTSTAFRFGVGTSCSADNLNCYTVTTSTHGCVGNASTTNATATFNIYYFAQSTGDASSSFPLEHWEGFVDVRDESGDSGSATSSAVDVTVLTAITLSTTTLNYGAISAGSDTGATNQIATSSNVGNSSTTIRLHAVSTLASGANSIATSSQAYSTSSFTYAGTSTALTGSPVTVPGFFLTSPTSLSGVEQATFWGLSVPGGTATGTYTGTNRFTSLFQP